MNLVTQSEAARILGITRTNLHKWQKLIPRPDFFVDGDNGKLMVNIDSKAWKEKVKRQKLPGKNRDKQGEGVAKAAAKKKAKKEIAKVKPVEPAQPEEPEEKPDPEYQALYKQAAIAEMKKTIHDAEIKAEKAKQEKIKTAELKKDLAPLSLIKHFFSFSENLIQRLYRRPHEISPQLSALYLAGEDKKAIQLIVRELEGIIVDVKQQLLADMEKEGYKKKYDKVVKK